MVRCANNWVDGMRVYCSQHHSRYPATLQDSSETRGKNTEAGNFMLVTGKQTAALAVVSALSMPGIST